MNYKERLKDYLDSYSSQYNFKDENDIEHDLNSDIEEMLKQNKNLEQALDEIEKYMTTYIKVEDRNENLKIEFNWLLKIIQKAKGDVKNENNNL